MLRSSRRRLIGATSARRATAWLALTAAGALWACADSTPTAPSLAASPYALAGRSEADKARHDSLKALADSLKDVYKQRKKDFHAAKDSAKKEWEIYKKSLEAARKLDKNASATLLRCEPQDYLGDAEVIGPEGGELKIGKHKLTIPRGALTRDELISGVAPVGDLVKLDFAPHGLMFAVSAPLTMDYSHCITPASFVYRIVYVNENLKILEFPPSADDKVVKSVVAPIDHFSGYVVAW